MKKIAIVLPYFGKLPNYFDLFLKSCEYNQDIDFLIYTDCKIEQEVNFQNNIKIVHCTFEEIREKIQSCFDFKINLPTPYFLCNFKPTYGLVFEDELQGYDFWGHCDADIIFGQIREKITDEVLEKYERIYPWGHLSLYKNEPDVNQRFMLPLKGEIVYQEMLSSDTVNAFDEWGSKGVSRIYKAHNIPIYTKHDMANIKINYHEFILDSDPDNYRYRQIFVWNNGNLYREYLNKNGKQKKETYIYIHLQKRRMQINTENKEKYLIVPNRFINYPNRGVTAKLIKKYSRQHFIYWNNVQSWYKGNILRRVKKLKGIINTKNE